MKNFIETFKHLCDFIYLDAPYEAASDPIPFFVKKGIKPPYRSWRDINLTKKFFIPNADGSVRTTLNKT